MTFDDDFCRLHLVIGTKTVACSALGLEWPPPERLWLDETGAREATDEDPPEGVLHRTNLSALTDEEREGMTHVARGAEYSYKVLQP